MMRSATLGSCIAIGCILGFPTEARAESVINNPGDHPSYSVELEPHAVLGWAHLYRDTGFGAGARLSIPIVENGFIKTINNSVAI